MRLWRLGQWAIAGASSLALLLVWLTGGLAQGPQSAEMQASVPLSLQHFLALPAPSAQDVSRLTEADAADAISYFAIRNDVTGISLMLDAGIAPDALNSHGSNALIAAIGADSLEAARTLLRSGADPAAESVHGKPEEFARNAGSLAMQQLFFPESDIDYAVLLSDAVRSADQEAIQKLLELGADPNALSPDGTTPLIEAAMVGHSALVDLLITGGADPTVYGEAGLSPLATAVLAGHVEVVEKLLVGGADANTTSAGVPMITAAVVMGNRDIVKVLLKAGADPEQVSADGVRAAAIAQLRGDEALAEQLGGAPELEEAPDLLSAIATGRIQMVEAALEAGADVNGRDDAGIPAVVLAMAEGNGTIVRRLIEVGADISATAPGGYGVLHAASANSDQNRAGVLSVLFDSISDFNVLADLVVQSDQSGRSGMDMLAVVTEGQHPRTLFSNLMSKWSPDEVSSLFSFRGDDGVSAFEAAVLTGNARLVSFLVQDVGMGPPYTVGGTSMQDLARSREQWAVLLALPDDRSLPEGLTRGASRSVRTAMQELLKQWGYYGGAVDGIIGPESRAAMITFLADRENELRRMAAADPESEIGEIHVSTSQAGQTTFSLSYDPPGGWCEWKIVNWNVTSGDYTTSFVGCVEGQSAWNGNGIAWVKYSGSSDKVILFGPNGWDDEVEF